MIGKISSTAGHSGLRLVRYLAGPGRHNEHRDQRVVGVGVAGGGEVLTGPLDANLAELLGHSLDAAAKLAGVKDGHIWHLSVALPAGDRVLSDVEWQTVAVEVARAVGFDAPGCAPATWVAVCHGLSVAGNQHLHFVASTVRSDGRRVSLWRDQVKVSALCAELEDRLRLQVVAGRPGLGRPGLSPGEHRRAQIAGEVPDRVRLGRIVRGAAAGTTSEAGFITALRRLGVAVRPRYDSGDKSKVVGYSVALRSGDQRPALWYGGGRLGRGLSLPQLREWWEQSPAAQREALELWRCQSATGVEIAEADIARLAGLSARLGAIGVKDMVSWQAAAPDVAGVLSALAERYEGSTPGPIGAAADLLSQVAPSHEPAAPGASSVAGGGGGTAAQLAVKDDTLGWVLLLRQMASTVESYQSAGAATGELTEAVKRLDAVRRELEEHYQKATDDTALKTTGRHVEDHLARGELDDELPPPHDGSDQLSR